jgi:hypothetical protein
VVAVTVVTLEGPLLDMVVVARVQEAMVAEEPVARVQEDLVDAAASRGIQTHSQINAMDTIFYFVLIRIRFRASGSRLLKR